MKKIPLLLLVLCICNGVIAQPAVIIKSYAYGQQTVPGMQREGAKELELTSSYFVYLEIFEKTNIAVKYIWLKGACSKPRVITVTQLPVLMQNEMGMGKQPTQLVPKTDNKVLQVFATTNYEDTKLITGKRLAAKNDMVVAYIYKGKWYYYTLKKITQLEKQYGV